MIYFGTFDKHSRNLQGILAQTQYFPYLVSTYDHIRDCTKCNKEFGNEQAYIDHMRAVHPLDADALIDNNQVPNQVPKAVPIPLPLPIPIPHPLPIGDTPNDQGGVGVPDSPYSGEFHDDPLSVVKVETNIPEDS